MTARQAICPTCRAKVAKDPARPSKLYPFCSERCHLVDLGRWFGEDYRIPGTPSVESVEAALAASSQADDE